MVGQLRFVNASGGTSDWVYPGPTIDLQSPASAQAIDSTTYLIYAEAFDRSQWEIAIGAFTLLSGTFARTTIIANSDGDTSKIDFGNPPLVSVYDHSAGTSLLAANNLSDVANAVTALANLSGVSYGAAQSLTAAQKAQARANIAAALRGQIWGVTLSTAGSSATFAVAAGEAADSTAADMMVLAASISKTTGAWAVGTGNGSFDGTGAAPSATAGSYHVFLIKRPDTGVVDVLTSNSATAPTLPTNYTLFRRIGSMKTDASFHWIAFIQIGDSFIWNVPTQDVNAETNPGTAARTKTLSVPVGIVVEAMIAMTDNEGSLGSNHYVLVTPLAIADTTPSAAAFTYFTEWAVSGGTSFQYNATTRVFTNVSAQIRVRQSASGAGDVFTLVTTGWIDRRGRDA